MAAALTAEDIAYWYLRLNGFFILRNFLVHGDSADPRGEIDLVGARFRHRFEHLDNPMQDDAWISQLDSNILVFCEVKRGAGNFNDCWKEPGRQIMESFLALSGILPMHNWSAASTDLYANGYHKPDDHTLITLLLIHGGKDEIPEGGWKEVKRLHFSDALRFIHRRFSSHAYIKKDHAQWELSGHLLWNCFTANKNNEDDFVHGLLREIGAL